MYSELMMYEMKKKKKKGGGVKQAVEMEFLFARTSRW